MDDPGDAGPLTSQPERQVDDPGHREEHQDGQPAHALHDPVLGFAGQELDRAAVLVPGLDPRPQERLPLVQRPDDQAHQRDGEGAADQSRDDIQAQHVPQQPVQERPSNEQADRVAEGLPGQCEGLLSQHQQRRTDQVRWEHDQVEARQQGPIQSDLKVDQEQETQLGQQGPDLTDQQPAQEQIGHGAEEPGNGVPQPREIDRAQLRAQLVQPIREAAWRPSLPGFASTATRRPTDRSTGS